MARCLFLLGMLAALAVGCGEDAGEKALREAGERLERAQAEVTAARSYVEREQNEFDRAEQELADARSQLEKAKRRLAEAQAQVGLHATDAVLFREIQTRLLDDEKLEKVAISARVEKGVVTLSGRVSSTQQRERAESLAEGVPGVLAVENRITVSDVAAEKGV